VPDPLLALARLPGVASSVAAADAALAAMLQGRGRRRISDEQVASALTGSARASAQLEGDPARWEPGCVRVATQLPSLATSRLPAGQLLARLHALAARGIGEPDELGRVRAGAGGDRLTGLLDLLAPGGTVPIVRSAVVHAELLTLAPFAQGNGVVARAAAHVVLIAAGIDPRAVLPLARGHLELAEEYAVAAAGYGAGTVPAVSAWLEHCARAMVQAAELSPLSTS